MTKTSKIEKDEIVILSGCRTPIGSFGKTLKDVRAHQLASLVITEAVNNHLQRRWIFKSY